MTDLIEKALADALAHIARVESENATMRALLDKRTKALERITDDTSVLAYALESYEIAKQALKDGGTP